jgi:hypothetical protein
MDTTSGAVPERKALSRSFDCSITAGTKAPLWVVSVIGLSREFQYSFALPTIQELRLRVNGR